MGKSSIISTSLVCMSVVVASAQADELIVKVNHISEKGGGTEYRYD
jgi:hypothetical protein